jgi:hypothetical protein
MLARFREEDFFGSCYGIGMPPIRSCWIRNLLHASATDVVGGEVNGKWTRTSRKFHNIHIRNGKTRAPSECNGESYLYS